MLYIAPRVWVLRTPNADPKCSFTSFLHERYKKEQKEVKMLKNEAKTYNFDLI